MFVVCNVITPVHSEYPRARTRVCRVRCVHVTHEYCYQKVLPRLWHARSSFVAFFGISDLHLVGPATCLTFTATPSRRHSVENHNHVQERKAEKRKNSRNQGRFSICWKGRAATSPRNKYKEDWCSDDPKEEGNGKAKAAAKAAVRRRHSSCTCHHLFRPMVFGGGCGC